MKEQKLIQFPTTIEKIGVILSLLALVLAIFLPKAENEEYHLIPLMLGSFAFVSVMLMALQLKYVHEALRSKHLTLMALIDALSIIAVLISLGIFKSV